MLYKSQIFDKVILLLSKYADSERASFSKWYYPTEMEVYGLKSADLKIIVASIKKEIKEDRPDSLISESIYLAKTGVFECQLVAYGLLNRNFKEIRKLTTDQILDLGGYMDNWVSTDSFSTQILGPAWRLGVLNDSDIEEWALSDNRWWRRNALVATVGINLKSQGGTGDAVRTLKICRMLIDDRDDMVVKAMSWALRELSKHNKEPVINFLAQYGDRIAARVKREVTKKLITGRKNG